MTSPDKVHDLKRQQAIDDAAKLSPDELLATPEAIRKAALDCFEAGAPDGDSARRDPQADVADAPILHFETRAAAQGVRLQTRRSSGRSGDARSYRELATAVVGDRAVDFADALGARHVGATSCLDAAAISRELVPAPGALAQAVEDVAGNAVGEEGHATPVRSAIPCVRAAETIDVVALSANTSEHRLGLGHATP